MSKLRKSYSAQEKARIALDAIKGELTQSQISSKYGTHSTQVANWKRQLKDGIVDIFKDKRSKGLAPDQSELIEELYKKIGQLEVELDWVKKKSDLFK